MVGASLLGLAAIGLFISTLTDAPVGAMAAIAGIAVLSGVLEAVPQLGVLHPWLLTHYWLTFGDLLRSPVRWMNQSVSNPPTRQASDPASSGAPASRLIVQKPWLSALTL